MTDDITKELAEIVKGFRWFADMEEPVNRGFLTRADAALELYAEPFMSPEKPLMTNCVVEGEPPNGCLAWNVWYEEFGSRGILNNLKISSLNDKPEPVITRVEVITGEGRVYTNWEKDNKITTSLQDDGKTLKVFVNTKTTEEPEMPITRPEFYDDLPPGDKTLYRVAEKEVSKQWANALSVLIEELSPHSSLSLWGYEGKTPTPERVVEYLREHIQYLQQLASDEELEACLGLIAKRYSGCNYEGIDTENEISSWMRNTRRPKPTLKSQALKDFETVRKHSDLLPEILDTIEKALKSLPDT